MPLGWLLSRYTRERLGLRAGSAEDCAVRSYAFAVLPVVNELGEFIAKHPEGLGAAIDTYTANCALKRLLELRDAR